jgi:hypothetical protein
MGCVRGVASLSFIRQSVLSRLLIDSSIAVRRAARCSANYFTLIFSVTVVKFCSGKN